MTRILRLLQPALVVVVASLALTFPAHAKEIRRQGAAGIGIGSGTLAHGLSGKYFLSDKLAVQANIGSFGNYKHYGGTAISADVVFAMPLLASGEVDLGWNVGAGGGFASYDSASITAFTGLVGLELLIDQIPIDLVLELRPIALTNGGLHILSGFADLTGHLRYYFR